MKSTTLIVTWPDGKVERWFWDKDFALFLPFELLQLGAQVFICQ